MAPRTHQRALERRRRVQRSESELLHLRLRRGLQLRSQIERVVERHPLFCERGRSGRDRLLLPRLLAGHVARRHRPLLNGPDRLAGHAIEHERPAHLRELDDRIDPPTGDGDRDEVRRRRQVAAIRIPSFDPSACATPSAAARRRLRASRLSWRSRSATREAPTTSRETETSESRRRRAPRAVGSRTPRRVRA
jgi:hypothetical protein